MFQVDLAVNLHQSRPFRFAPCAAFLGRLPKQPLVTPRTNRVQRRRLPPQPTHPSIVCWNSFAIPAGGRRRRSRSRRHTDQAPSATVRARRARKGKAHRDGGALTLGRPAAVAGLEGAVLVPRPSGSWPRRVWVGGAVHGRAIHGLQLSAEPFKLVDLVPEDLVEFLRDVGGVRHLAAVDAAAEPPELALELVDDVLNTKLLGLATQSAKPMLP